jgi:HAD superfamily hydrolase (TIGR01459 family)
MSTRRLDHFADVAASFDAILCDVWGVLHNGVAPFEAACDALRLFRAGGGHVLLVSNAPRPGFSVREQLARIGVPQDAYDDVLTSGDVTRRIIAGRAGEALLHIGPARDLALFEGLDAPRVPVSQARYVVCTGLIDDETETAEDYLPELTAAHALGLTMICANPDLVVDRGGRNIPCAGAIGAAYEALGGEVVYPGKPHRAIYDVALERLGERGRGAVELSRLLGLGDAIRTDIAGASALGIASLMVLEGIHAHEVRGMTPDRLEKWLAAQSHMPNFAMPVLRW